MRLAATMRCDVRLQVRNGFYWAVAFLLAVFGLILVWLPDLDWAPAVPAVVLGNLVVGTFLFMAGLVLLEKDEGTLAALSVTPLSRGEYLTSKVVTLTGLSIVENVALVVLVVGSAFRPLPLVLGIVLASALYCLTGFAAVARYDSINEFLFPSMLYTALFALPFLPYTGIWESPVMYLHPLQAPLVILRGTVAPLAAWEWLYGIGYSLLCAALAFGWSRNEMRRLVAGPTGARRG